MGHKNSGPRAGVGPVQPVLAFLVFIVLLCFFIFLFFFFADPTLKGLGPGLNQTYGDKDKASEVSAKMGVKGKWTVLESDIPNFTIHRMELGLRHGRYTPYFG
ncbi:hypothetical protein AMTR_s00104p00037440 [Amborella trichopoda]|uniref:Uncharacterized protein n=1 Tax=Amborella trichopoda TaxID=13333 RepID=W1NY85_AMBTC|nr:hypothetical protein AMTR_s00104p00037440 [Amborella trichopoda]